ncbi:MAG: hypothetical protein AAGE01_19470 [Pseudomonadota bacterium]
MIPTLMAMLFTTLALDDLLVCQAEAAGPRAVPRTIEVELDIREPTFEVSGVYRATRDGRMRIDIYAGGERVFAEALDGDRAWEWTPGDGVSVVDGQAQAALRRGIELPGRFFNFADMAERGHRLEDHGAGTIDDRPVRILDVVLDDRHRKRYWLDAQSCRVVRNRDERAFHPGIDATAVTVESRLSDYRLIDGRLVAFETVQWDVGADAWLGSTTVKAVRFDPDLSAVRFDLRDLAPD